MVEDVVGTGIVDAIQGTVALDVVDHVVGNAILQSGQGIHRGEIDSVCIIGSCNGRVIQAMDVVGVDACIGAQSGKIDGISRGAERGAGGTADVVALNDRVESSVGIETIEIEITDLVAQEPVVLIGDGAASHIGDRIITTGHGVVAERVSIAVGTAGGGGRSSAGANDDRCKVGAG